MTMLRPDELPEDLCPTVAQIAALAREPRYLGAIIFGSVARGCATPQSDLDVKVIVDEDNPCPQINHPPLHLTRTLDLSFRSLVQLEAETEATIAAGERQPLLAGARIIFDKTGRLPALIARADAARPRPVAPEDMQQIHFLIAHADNKVVRALVSDPATALLAMHTGLSELLHIHYRLQGHWWLSSKWLLADLRVWDASLSRLVERLVTTGAVAEKVAAWSAIIDHVLDPLGGRVPPSANNCDCPTCRGDLAMLLAGR
jgi:predicted nucleotidyltransferase